MKFQWFTRIVLVGVFFLGTTAGNAAPAYPFLSPLRVELLAHIAVLNDTTNGPLTRAEQSQLRTLSQVQRLLDRRGRVSLVNDLVLLSSASTLLTRNFPGGEFAPLLDDAVGQYANVMQGIAETLATRIEELPPSTQTTIAVNSLRSLNQMLDNAADATTPAAAARLLTTAASRLASVQSLVDRANRVPAVQPRMVANIDGRYFNANPATLSATYNSALGILTVSGTQSAGLTTESRSITLQFLDVTLGTTTHLFGSVGSGTYGILTRRGTNIFDYTSAAGSGTVNIDISGQVARGTFSFTGANALSFDAPVSVSGGSFSVRLR